MQRRRIILGFPLLALCVSATLSASTFRSLAVEPLPVDVFAKIHAIQGRTLGTDYKCVGDCTQAGYLYSLCQSKCSYPDQMPNPYTPPAYTQPHGTDFQCVNNCTQQGYQYAYCHAKCSY